MELILVLIFVGVFIAIALPLIAIASRATKKSKQVLCHARLGVVG